MNFDSIVSQVHCPPFDVQGGLPGQEKKKLIQLALRHLRLMNPSTRIVFVGHGIRPDKQYLDMCDTVIWNNTHEPLNPNGTMVGQPAQFKYVSAGIREAHSERCLKIRGDSLWGIPNFASHCEYILEKEKKVILLSQQTCHSSMRIGDCFMYGDTALLHKIWSSDNPVVVDEGLQNTAANFCRSFGVDYPPKVWGSWLKSIISFRDTISLKWADLRWTWNGLIAQKGYQQLEKEVLDGEFDFRQYAWGEQWHSFDSRGKMTHRYLPDLISEREWYDRLINT